MDGMSAPIRVVMTTDAVGGVWRYALDAAAELRGDGVAVTLVGLGPRPDDRQNAEVETAGIPLFWLDTDLDWTVDDFAGARCVGLALDAFVRNLRPHLLHINTPALAPFVSAHVPQLVATHSCLATWWQATKGTPLPDEWQWHRRLTGLGLANGDIAVAPSAAFAAAVQREYGPLRHMRVVHNGGRPIAPGRKGAFALSAGRWWDEAKNAAVLKAAAERTIWPVQVAGALRGPRGDGIEAGPLQWLGELPHGQLAEWIAQAPVFVSLSLYEPFGLSVLEAASAGAALVLADIPTFRELWGGCAVFVDPSDPGAVAAALDDLAGDPARRERLGADASMRARDFSLRRQADGLLDAYRSVLQEQKLAV